MPSCPHDVRQTPATDEGKTVCCVDRVWNVMAHAQKPYFVFRRNGRVRLNRQWRQFGRLLAAEVRALAVVMLDTPSSEVVWRVLATHSIRQYPLHFPSRVSPCAITFQLDSTSNQQGTVYYFSFACNFNSCYNFLKLHTDHWVECLVHL